MSLFQYHVGCDGAVEQLQQVVFLQRLQYVELTAREQRPYHLKRGILRRGSYQRHDTFLYGAEQRVLLRFRETVNLVDEEDGRGFVEETPFLCPFDHVAHVLHATGHCREREERRL